MSASNVQIRENDIMLTKLNYHPQARPGGRHHVQILRWR